MIQLTIDSLVKKNSNDNKYFYLDWTDRDLPKKNAVFFNSIVGLNYNVKKTVINKFTFFPFVLVGNIKIEEYPIKKLGIEFENVEYSNIHILKSHLQKCIRRKRTENAIKTAKHLIDLDPIQFLRRLAIIIIEDTTLCECYSTLIWLLVACSSLNCFTLGINHKEWLLGLVYIVSTGVYKEYYFEQYTSNIFETICNDKNLNENEKSVIFSIGIRISYGGMSGDIKMLKKAIVKFYNRFRKIKETQKNIDYKKWDDYFRKKINTISLDVEPLSKKKWELSAIDYHCFPKLIEFINRNFDDDELPEDELKKIIWEKRSSLNFRINFPDNSFYKEKKSIDDISSRNNSIKSVHDVCILWKDLERILNRISFYVINNYS